MSRVQAWKEVIDKVKSRLSKWKMKALSIGGRLTLLKSVLGSIPIFHMSIFRVPSSVLHTLESIRSQFFNGHEVGSNKATWVKWNSILTAKDSGGLGVSSIYALNRGLMMKWVWRFYNQKTSLWANVIKAIHGEDGNMGKAKYAGSTWMVSLRLAAKSKLMFEGVFYVISSVMHLWSEIKKSHKYKGPKHAGVVLKDNLMAKSIHKMLTDVIDTWAPKLSVKKSVVYFFSRNITEEMHMGHLRSTFIGETLARMLEYSGVVVLRKRIHDEDHLDIQGNSSYDLYISETLNLLRGNALRHALDVEKADWIVHVTDAGQRDYIDMCITAATRVGLITDDHSKYPLSHVGFGHVQGDDFERYQNMNTKVVRLVNLLDEAKSQCKVLLAGQAGMADEWTAEELEHAAEVLGYSAVKYADLKNNRLTNYTFSFEQILNEEEFMAEELTLTNDDERELGLHLLRFTEVLGEACTILAPHILCEYLYELCKKFNGLRSSMWQVVVSSEETSKLLLCKATEVVMRKCFDLLGITPICKI
nr:aminoacyl-tRNA synthetase, class 1a, anticodon-binding [Tanacetum cinerariifolium]